MVLPFYSKDQNTDLCTYYMDSCMYDQLHKSEIHSTYMQHTVTEHHTFLVLFAL
jgi:hypothetical protein